MNYFIINTDAKSFRGNHNVAVWLQNNMAFTGGPPEYGQQLAPLRPGDLCLLYENGVGVIAIGRVLEPWDGRGYNPPKYYEDADLPEYRIDVDWFLSVSHQPIKISQLRQILKYAPRWAPSKAVTPIVRGQNGLSRLISDLIAHSQFMFPEEVREPAGLVEGALTSVLVNSYERSSEARRRCIDRWGLHCAVCEMSFEQSYGALGSGFIHVHHLNPLAALRQEYVIDPEADLRPVCPNCHAMLHKRNPPYMIEELQGARERANNRLQADIR